MSKFRFYVTDVIDGCVKGTDEEVLARSMADSEDYFVVDTETGQWLLPGDDSTDVSEVEYVESEDEDE